MRNIGLFIIVFVAFLQTGNSQFFEYPPCWAYDTLGRDTIRVVNTYSNKFYAGIDNAFEIDTQKIGWKPKRIEINQGNFFEDEPYYYFIPSGIKPVGVKLFKDTNDSLPTITKFLEVKGLPQPYISISRINLHDTIIISRKCILAEKKLEVHVSPDIIDDSKWFKITDFIFGYPKSRMYITKYNEGAKFTPEILEIISLLPVYTEISLNVKVSSIGGVLKSMPLIKVRIVD